MDITKRPPLVIDLPLKRWGLPQRGNDDLRPWGFTRNRGATTTVTCKWEGMCERVRYNQERVCEASPERVSWLEHQRMRNEQGGSVERASRLENWGVLERQSYDPHSFSSMIIGSLNLLPYTHVASTCKLIQNYHLVAISLKNYNLYSKLLAQACPTMSYTFA